MHTRTAVLTTKAPPPLPVYSQAIICNGMVYCSGQVGIDPATKQMKEGGAGERTVGSSSWSLLFTSLCKHLLFYLENLALSASPKGPSISISLM